jgi:type I restriction-modification system DNA methylase subunit
MKKTKETFSGLFKDFEYRYDLRTVFNDFLTLTTCACSQNPLTRLSHDEDLYLETIAPYKDDTLRHHFPKMLACLAGEMEERINSDMGNDVLGEYYEQHLYRKGAAQYFIPWPVCSMMAKCTVATIDVHATRMPLRILDPCCGSGRMLVASAKENSNDHEYYGIDIDHTCVKMTAINLFLNGMFHSEVMCGDALDPDDFRGSYQTSFLPFGIFRIAEKENSWLYMLHKNSFQPAQADVTNAPKIFQGKSLGNGSQLKLF